MDRRVNCDDADDYCRVPAPIACPLNVVCFQRVRYHGREGALNSFGRNASRRRASRAFNSPPAWRLHRRWAGRASASVPPSARDIGWSKSHSISGVIIFPHRMQFIGSRLLQYLRSFPHCRVPMMLIALCLFVALDCDGAVAADGDLRRSASLFGALVGFRGRRRWRRVGFGRGGCHAREGRYLGRRCLLLAIFRWLYCLRWLFRSNVVRFVISRAC